MIILGAGSVIALAANYCMLKEMVKTSENAELREELKFRDYADKLNLEYYSSLIRDAEQTRRLRHDINNLLATASALVRDGSEESMRHAENLIDDIDATMNSFATEKLCDNTLVNAIASNKLRECQAAGIECELSLQFAEETEIADIDLCRIFTNLFDNAINAQKKLAAGREKHITLKCAPDGERLIIRCENPYESDNENPEDKKKRKHVTGHGYGIDILRSSAERYQGQLAIAKDNGMYVVTISV